MPKGYSMEMANEYLKQQAEADTAKDKEKMKKLGAQAKRASDEAGAALSQAARNRETIDALRAEAAGARRLAIISMVISVICMAMVMADELSRMLALFP